MFEESPTCKLCDEFDVKELVKVNTASANRSRWLTLVLVVATVIIAIGFYNSLKTSWANHRIQALNDFENTPENNMASGQKPLLDDFFGVNDFSDFKSFACKFESANFPDAPNGTDKLLNLQNISHYIFNALNAQTKISLSKECKPEKKEEGFSDADTAMIKGDLDRLLYDRFLYSKDRFPGLANRKEETYRLIEIATDKSSGSVLGLKESDLVRMNRLLLEEAYKRDILESKIHISSFEKRAAKEIPGRIAYDENILFLKSPIFGVSIDVNDLGLIGGISLFIILCLLRFSLSREIKNLNLSFKEAFQQGKLCSFYHSLAMQQVLVSPPMEGEIRNKLLAMLPKWTYLLPVIIIGLGVGYDYYSVIVHHFYEWQFVENQLYFQIIPCFVLVLYMSLRCLERQFHIDRIWDHFYYIRRYGFDTLKLTYESEVAKKPSGIFDEKLVDICEYYFPEKPQNQPFWMLTLFRIAEYNLKALDKWITIMDSALTSTLFRIAGYNFEVLSRWVISLLPEKQRKTKPSEEELKQDENDSPVTEHPG